MVNRVSNVFIYRCVAWFNKIAVCSVKINQINFKLCRYLGTFFF